MATVLERRRARGLSFELRVRVDGAALEGLCPPGEPPLRELVIQRRGPAAAFRRGATVVLAPAEAGMLFPAAASGEAKAESAGGAAAAGALAGAVALSGAWLEASVVPHLGGRVHALRLRSSGFAPLDARPVLGVQGGCDPGGIADAAAGWKTPSPGWSARYRCAAGRAGTLCLRGRAEDLRFERTLELVEEAPLLLVTAKVAKGGTKPSACGKPPEYEARVALRSKAAAPLRFWWPEGGRVADFRAVPDPASFHPLRQGEVERIALPAGALAAVAGDRGAVLVLAEPGTLGRVFLREEPGRVTVQARFGQARCRAAAYALAVLERVAIGPRGVLGAAAGPSGAAGEVGPAGATEGGVAGGSVRVALLLRDLDAPDEPLTAEACGRPVVLRPRSLGGAGRVHLGEVRLPAADWRAGGASVRVAEGEYRL